MSELHDYNFQDELPEHRYVVQESAQDNALDNSSVSEQANINENEQSVRFETEGIVVKSPNWLKKNVGKLSLAALLVGGGYAFISNPASELEHKIEKVAPWTLGGLAATEVAWIGGAAMMAAGAGKNIGGGRGLINMRSRWQEFANDTNNSNVYKAGLHINTGAALAASGVLIAGAVNLPPSFWPGALALVSLDLGSTYAIRAPLYRSIKRTEVDKSRQVTTESKPERSDTKVKVRKATIEDIDRLADLDLELFDKAYGVDKPQKAQVVDMLTKRYLNAPEWMFVAEMNGRVEGFVSAFRTNKTIEEFVSWEDSTANGTLEGRVDDGGKYAYVTNMTIKHAAVINGAEEMLLANLFVKGIKEGIEYGYFVARMPQFKRWLRRQGVIDATDDRINDYAESYFNLRKENGKRYDRQLRMYEDFGFKLERLVANGFEDEASLNYAVVCKTYVPPRSEILKRIKPVRSLMSIALKQIAKKPKLLKKVI